jgi:hypothetical protein
MPNILIYLRYPVASRSRVLQVFASDDKRMVWKPVSFENKIIILTN